MQDESDMESAIESLGHMTEMTMSKAHGMLEILKGMRALTT